MTLTTQSNPAAELRAAAPILTGAQRIAAFADLPPEMQAGAFLALRRTIEERREREREG
jgi:hypothetical protein